MNQQRQVVYKKRNGILKDGKGVDFLEDAIHQMSYDIVQKNSPEAINSESWELNTIADAIKLEFQNEVRINPHDLEREGTDVNGASADMIAKIATAKVLEEQNRKLNIFGEENLKQFEHHMYLQVIDNAWKDHLQSMDQLRDAVSLRGYGQRDPLQEYKKEGFRSFSDMIERIEFDTALAIVRLPLPDNAEQYEIQTSAPQEDLSGLEMTHPDSEDPTNNDDLVYNGSGGGGGGGGGQRQSSVETFKREQPKVGRNDACPCGSGKKFKKCHGRAGSEPLGMT